MRGLYEKALSFFLLAFFAVYRFITMERSEPKFNGRSLSFIMSTEIFTNTIKSDEIYKEVSSKDLLLLNNVLNSSYRSAIQLNQFEDIITMLQDDGYTIEQVQFIEEFNHYLSLKYCLNKDWLSYLEIQAKQNSIIELRRMYYPEFDSGTDTTLMYWIEEVS